MEEEVVLVVDQTLCNAVLELERLREKYSVAWTLSPDVHRFHNKTPEEYLEAFFPVMKEQDAEEYNKMVQKNTVTAVTIEIPPQIQPNQAITIIGADVRQVLVGVIEEFKKAVGE